MAPDRAMDYRFEIAISFAGDNKRDIVRTIAEILRDELGNGRIFFDEWFEAELAGPDAQIVLQDIYRRHTRLVVTCVCRRYGEKPWTQEEWRAIQAFERDLRDAGSGNIKRLRFLPLRFSDGEIDGLFDTAIVPDVRGRSPRQIADLILERLRLSKLDAPLSSTRPTLNTPNQSSYRKAVVGSSPKGSLIVKEVGTARYILYIARERVGLLYLQVSPEILETPILDDSKLLQYREPNAQTADEAGRIRAVRQLFTVLEHLESSATIGNLNGIIEERGILDSDWYHVRCSFNCERWDSHNSAVELSAILGSYKLIISCSKSNLAGVNKEGSVYVPTSISHALLDGGMGIPLSGLVKLAAIDRVTMTLRGSALYLVVEPLRESLGL